MGHQLEVTHTHTHTTTTKDGVGWQLSTYVTVAATVDVDARDGEQSLHYLGVTLLRCIMQSIMKPLQENQGRG